MRRHLCFLLLLVGCADSHAEPPPLVGPVPLARGVKLRGPAANANAGASVACLGDVDGDGRGDLVIGAPHDVTAAHDGGAAYMFYGPLDEDASLATADALLFGTGAGDNAGISVAGAGDVDGDGFGDVVVGAWHADGPGGTDAGAAYLFYGPVEGLRALDEADVVLSGEATDDSAGFAVAGAGDLDGDGHDDLAVAAFHASGERDQDGAIYVLYGPLAPGRIELSSVRDRIVGEVPGDHAGIAFGRAGDVDGDGRDDLVVGAPFHNEAGEAAGAAYVVAGPVRGTVNLGFALAKLLGETAGDQAGSSVAGIGDVDGDGFRDLIIGAPHSSRAGDRAGAAYVVRGPIAGTRSLGDSHAVLLGAAPRDEAGISVAGTPDLDHDGTGEIVVGAWAARGQAGAAYLFRGLPPAGAVSLAGADVELLGERADDGAGVSVAGCDVDGDGRGDLVVGAWAEDSGGLNSGAAYVMPGR